MLGNVASTIAACTGPKLPWTDPPDLAPYLLPHNPCTKSGMHARRNMDIIGVPGVAAEAELLAAIVLFHERLGLTSADVVIKVRAHAPLAAFFGAAHCTMV